MVRLDLQLPLLSLLTFRRVVNELAVNKLVETISMKLIRLLHGCSEENLTIVAMLATSEGSTYF